MTTKKCDGYWNSSEPCNGYWIDQEPKTLDEKEREILREIMSNDTEEMEIVKSQKELKELGNRTPTFAELLEWAYAPMKGKD